MRSTGVTTTTTRPSGGDTATTTRPSGGFMLRLPEDALAKLDARVERMRADMPGVTITRQDVVRQAILTFLKEEP